MRYFRAEIFTMNFAALEPRVEVNPQVVEPVEGALRMARRALERGLGTRPPLSVSSV